MAKSGICTPYKDLAVEIPSPGDAVEHRFGDEMETLRGGDPPTPGIMKRVQFMDLHDGQGKAGRVRFTKIEGGGTSNE